MWAMRISPDWLNTGADSVAARVASATRVRRYMGLSPCVLTEHCTVRATHQTVDLYGLFIRIE
jgi:hypothetical protein